jgi:hypothetical protein
MNDRAFALAILDNMVQDDSWRSFLSALRSKVSEYDACDPPKPIVSIEFVTAIREEYWFRYRDDPQSNSYVFSARSEADKRGSKRTRPQNANNPPPKRTRNDKHCSNTHCGAQRGHDFNECIAYGGGSQGKYTEWWRGPWNIHLPLEKRNRSNNIPPESHPAFAKFKAAAPKISAITYSHTTSRSDTEHELSCTDDDPIISVAIANETPQHVFNACLDDELIVASLPVLDEDLPHTDHCHHDSAANRHVFHDRTAFEDYKSITPLPVKGFGRNLSTVAVGCGSVRLRCNYGGRTYSILLTNVLHIPAARSNLISGVRLDKAGVTSTLGNGTVTLSLHGSPIISGNIQNDMYRLNLSIVRPAFVARKRGPSPSTAPQASSTISQNPDFYIA